MLTCTFEDGAIASKRHIVIDALIIKDNKILLIKRSQTVPEPGKLTIPGGFLDRDETIEEGIKREVLEETGWNVSSLTLFRINSNPGRPKDQERQNVDMVFLVSLDQHRQEPDNETENIGWYSLDNLPSPDEFAFDHFENVTLAAQHIKNPKTLPYIT